MKTIAPSPAQDKLQALIAAQETFSKESTQCFNSLADVGRELAEITDSGNLFDDAVINRLTFLGTKQQANDGNPLSLRDGRSANGPKVTILESDIALLRHVAGNEQTGRLDTTWREKHALLSEETRRRYPYSQVMPEKVRELVNPRKVEALVLRRKGKLALRRAMGGVKRHKRGMHSMQVWVADDVTSNIEVVMTNLDSSISLITPQIVAVMDSASLKYVDGQSRMTKRRRRNWFAARFWTASKLMECRSGFVWRTGLCSEIP
jgi:hypothetical protein